jgi:uncharacterized cupredoxin-like copper-binding protein
VRAHARILVAATALAVLTACGGGDGGSSASSAATGSSTSAASSAASGTGAAGSGAAGSSGAAGTSGSESEDRSITATEADFTISLDEDTLKAGTYKVRVKNEGHATHDLVVEKNGVDVAHGDLIAPGDSTTFTVDLAPGNYVLYCSVANHRQLGMELAFTVR